MSRLHPARPLRTPSDINQFTICLQVNTLLLLAKPRADQCLWEPSQSWAARLLTVLPSLVCCGMLGSIRPSLSCQDDWQVASLLRAAKQSLEWCRWCRARCQHLQGSLMPDSSISDSFHYWVIIMTKIIRMKITSSCDNGVLYLQHK